MTSDPTASNTGGQTEIELGVKQPASSITDEIHSLHCSHDLRNLVPVCEPQVSPTSPGTGPLSTVTSPSTLPAPGLTLPAPGLNPNAHIFHSSKTTSAKIHREASHPDRETAALLLVDSLNNAVPSPSDTGTVTDNGLPDAVSADQSQIPGIEYPMVPNSPEVPGNRTGTGSSDSGYLASPTDQASLDENSSVEDRFDVDDELIGMLRQQLEFYFSRENLAVDSYLVSQMDGDQFVPVAIIANFNQVKRLTTDRDLIVTVLRDSPNVQVDDKGDKVRPLHKRCVVILREIPNCTPLKEVERLFSGERCPKFSSCEFAHNNCWNVTFESESDAQRAYQYLREDVKTFQGRPIMARMKAKPIVLNTYTPKNGYSKSGVGSFETGTPLFSQTTQFTANPPTFSTPRSTLHFLNGNQTFPFFHAPSLLAPAWPVIPHNTAAPFFDPMPAFAVNGFQPQGYKFTNPAPVHTGYNQRQRRNPRVRRRREDARDGDGATNNTEKLPNAPTREDFELKMDSFPELVPGGLASTTPGEFFENKLSDVVKGKVKPSIKCPPSPQTHCLKDASPNSTNSINNNNRTHVKNNNIKNGVEKSNQTDSPEKVSNSSTSSVNCSHTLGDLLNGNDSNHNDVPVSQPSKVSYAQMALRAMERAKENADVKAGSEVTFLVSGTGANKENAQTVISSLASSRDTALGALSQTNGNPDHNHPKDQRQQHGRQVKNVRQPGSRRREGHEARTLVVR